MNKKNFILLTQKAQSKFMDKAYPFLYYLNKSECKVLSWTIWWNIVERPVLTWPEPPPRKKKKKTHEKGSEILYD